MPSRPIFINQNKKQNMNTTPLSNQNFKPNSIPFAFPAPAARQVSLAGDFNNWDPKAMPMRKGANGVWHLSVALKPGRQDAKNVFPVRFESEVELVGGPVRGSVPGFLILEDFQTRRTRTVV